MYSLTEATDLLSFSQIDWLNNTKEKSILSYNSHKLRHTIWVLEAWRNIIIKMKETKELSDDIINKSEICFLLHDLWRFYQNDSEKVLKNDIYNHWEKSFEIVKNNWYVDSICLAIRYHDKYSIDWLYSDELYLNMKDTEKEETLFLAKILRDADKLQNMIYSVFNLAHLSKIDVYWDWLKNTDISDINLVAIKKHILIDRNNIFSYWDYILSSLCFVFDIHFNETIEILNFYWYFDKIYKLLESSNWVSIENLEIVKNEILNFKI